ncbi:MAG: hypothetical protein J6J42_08645 [Lachnospiraceae bacterium]|nr:hypothetical protein [Lachnospiraceae bacterium]
MTKKNIVAFLLTGSMLLCLTACRTSKDADTIGSMPSPTTAATPTEAPASTVAPTETPTKTPEPTATAAPIETTGQDNSNETTLKDSVDYSKEITDWMYLPESEDSIIQLLKKIDSCRYGSAGASLDQISAAIALLSLTEQESVTDSLRTYLDGMDATQLDYFSFQWQMNTVKAHALLGTPSDYTGLLEDSGNGTVILENFDAAKLEELNQMVLTELNNRGITDEWKHHTDLEPFFQWAMQVGTPETKDSVISPLPVTIDMNDLTNCTLAVSFKKGDAYVDDTGAMQLKVTVYTYDLYDMIDIALLKEGDTLVLRGQEVPVTSLTRTDQGSVEINGGLDNGGYELSTDNNTVFYETGYSDVKSYYALGEATLRVSGDFIFTDASDLDKEEVIYYPGDFLTDDAGIDYYFSPHNTSIVIKDGQVISMQRVYTP